MPPDLLHETVEVLRELPGEAALADARGTDDRHAARPLFAARGMEQVLEHAQLVLAADERRLEGVGTTLATPLGDDPQCPPGGDGEGLALERLLADRFEHDRDARGPLGRLSHEHAAGCRGGLEPGGGVDQVARDHTLVGRTDGDRRLAGQHPSPGRDPGPQRADRIDQVERCTDGPFRVVLARDRGTPDRHDRITDELLDRAAVSLDDIPAEVEVAGQEFVGLLGVTPLRERRESHEVREQDRYQATLGDRGRHGSRGCRSR